MNLNILLRDTLLHILLNTITFLILMHYQFELSGHTFTILLGFNLFLVTLLTGISSKKIGAEPKLNGWMVGAISYGILMLILAQYVTMNLSVNAVLFAIWSLLGFIGGLFGGFIGKPGKANA